MAERWGCARSALTRLEPLFATASTVRRWIMVEQPGPWGREAVLESRLPRPTAARLQARAQELGARLILIRRHGRADPSRTAGICFVAVTDPRGVWMERLDFTRPDELLDADLTGLAEGTGVGGSPVPEPVYLVCTNGSHDACCAEFGRPLAHALTEARRVQTWECSHIGGDRFAGNLLCFPHGLYFGRVDPVTAPRIAEDYERGQIPLDWFRGRAGQPFPVQAAEYFVRTETGIRGIDDVAIVNWHRAEGDVFLVTVAAGSSRYLAEVLMERDAEGHELTCHSDRLVRAPRYRLLRLTAE